MREMDPEIPGGVARGRQAVIASFTRLLPHSPGRRRIARGTRDRSRRLMALPSCSTLASHPASARRSQRRRLQATPLSCGSMAPGSRSILLAQEALMADETDPATGAGERPRPHQQEDRPPVTLNESPGAEDEANSAVEDELEKARDHADPSHRHDGGRGY